MKKLKTILFRLIIRHLFLLFFMFFSLSGFSQGFMTMYGLKGLPNNNELNPSLYDDSSKLYIGLPVLSGISMKSSLDFAYSDLIHYRPAGDSLIIDIPKFYNKLKNKNKLSLESTINLFSFAIRGRSKKEWLGFDNFRISFDIKERLLGQIGIDKGYFTLLHEGNVNYLGKNFDLGNMSMNMTHYREYGIGFTKDIMLFDKRFSAGVRTKFLFGKGNLNADKFNMQLLSDDLPSFLQYTALADANVSSPLIFTFNNEGLIDDVNSSNLEDTDSIIGYLRNTKNKGFALDLGATYEFSDKITFGASLIDFGTIRWKKGVYNLSANASYRFNGVDLTQSINEDDADYKSTDDVLDEMLDSLENSYKITNSENKYSTPIPTKMYFYGNYKLNYKLDFGLLSRFYFYENNSDFALTLSANAKPVKWFSFSASYSAINGNYNNLGIGMTLRGGPVQFYLLSDNIAAAMRPSRAQFINFRFGINLLFGRDWGTYVVKSPRK